MGAFWTSYTCSLSVNCYAYLCYIALHESIDPNWSLGGSCYRSHHQGLHLVLCMQANFCLCRALILGHARLVQTVLPDGCCLYSVDQAPSYVCPGIANAIVPLCPKKTSAAYWRLVACQRDAGKWAGRALPRTQLSIICKPELLLSKGQSIWGWAWYALALQVLFFCW